MNTSIAKQHQRARRSNRQRGWVLGLLGALGLIVVIFALVQAVQPTEPVGGQVITNGKTLGLKSAPVVIQEFADFQCPYCGRFHATVEPQLIQQYVNTGKVRFEYHHFIIIDGNVGGTESRQAAEASECANAQGQFWQYRDLLFSHQGGEGSGAFSDPHLLSFAQTLGLNLNDFQQGLSSHQYAAAVQADEQLGQSLGVQGTPTLFINGMPVANPLDFASLQRQIEAALAQVR